MNKLGTAVTIVVSALASPALADSLEVLRAEVANIAEIAGGNVGASIAFAGGEPIDLIHGDRPFPMMSTVKVPISLQALDLVSQGEMSLETLITIDADDLSVLSPVSNTFPLAPVTSTLYSLMWTTIVDSDNASPNAIMRAMSGPEGVEEWVRAHGIKDMDITRNLNELFADTYGVETFGEVRAILEERGQEPGGAEAFFIQPIESPTWTDPRDTTSPNAMVDLLSSFMAGDLLDQERTAVLVDIMEQTRTGADRLRGMLPPGTVAGNKTGTGHDVVNDVGWIRLPDGRILTIAVYNNNKAAFLTKERVIAQIARAAYDWAVFTTE